MLEDEINKIEWEHRIPKSVELNFDEKEDKNCPICKNREANVAFSPFILFDVPNEKIIPLMKEYFSLEVDVKIIKEHKNHVVKKSSIDSEIKDRAIEDLKLIESDITSQVDEKKIIESSLRSLFAKKLEFEKKGDTGKAYRDVMFQLEKWTELKLKTKGKIQESVMTVPLVDLIKFSRGEVSVSGDNTNNTG